MAVASLVLGIVSLVIGAIFPYLGIYGAIAGVVGIVLAVLAKKKGEKKGMATAGLVCSIIGLVLCVVLYIACAAAAAPANDLLQNPELQDTLSGLAEAMENSAG